MQLFQHIVDCGLLLVAVERFEIFLETAVHICRVNHAGIYLREIWLDFKRNIATARLLSPRACLIEQFLVSLGKSEVCRFVKLNSGGATHSLCIIIFITLLAPDEPLHLGSIQPGVQCFPFSCKTGADSVVFRQRCEVFNARTFKHVLDFVIVEIHAAYILADFEHENSLRLAMGIEFKRILYVALHSVWTTVETDNSKSLFMSEQAVGARKCLDKVGESQFLIHVDCVDVFRVEAGEHLVNDNHYIKLLFAAYAVIRLLVSHALGHIFLKELPSGYRELLIKPLIVLRQNLYKSHLLDCGSVLTVVEDSCYLQLRHLLAQEPIVGYRFGYAACCEDSMKLTVPALAWKFVHNILYNLFTMLCATIL